jgi:C-terminal processing protease CtpA/Prc
MRYAFGLVGLLVGVGIIAMMMSQQLDKHGPVQQGLKAQDEARQIAGIGAKESVVMEPVDQGGKVAAIEIKSLVAGGPIEKYYGLQAGDKVIEVGPQKVRDMNDADLAESLILETYQRSGTIVIERNGQRMTLPASGGNNPGVVGGNPLKAIQGIPTH